MVPAGVTRRGVVIRAIGLWAVQTVLAAVVVVTTVFFGYALGVCADLTPAQECAARGTRAVIAMVILLTIGLGVLGLVTERLSRWVRPWFWSRRPRVGSLVLVVVMLASWGAAFLALVLVGFPEIATPVVGSGLHLVAVTGVLVVASARQGRARAGERRWP
jgi:hypothetical protein